MKGLVYGTQRQKNSEFKQNVKQFVIQFKQAHHMMKSHNAYEVAKAREVLQNLNKDLNDEQKGMIQTEMRLQEKRSYRTNQMAMKSQDRRSDWMSHTLEAIEKDINKGGKQNMENAQTIAQAFYFGSNTKPDKTLKSPQKIDELKASQGDKTQRLFFVTTKTPQSPIDRKASSDWKMRYMSSDPTRDMHGVYLRTKQPLKIVQHKQMSELRKTVRQRKSNNDNGGGDQAGLSKSQAGVLKNHFDRMSDVTGARTGTRNFSKPITGLKAIDSIFKYDDNQASSRFNSDRMMLASSENPLDTDRTQQETEALPSSQPPLQVKFDLKPNFASTLVTSQPTRPFTSAHNPGRSSMATKQPNLASPESVEKTVGVEHPAKPTQTNSPRAFHRSKISPTSYKRQTEVNAKRIFGTSQDFSRSMRTSQQASSRIASVNFHEPFLDKASTIVKSATRPSTSNKNATTHSTLFPPQGIDIKSPNSIVNKTERVSQSDEYWRGCLERQIFGKRNQNRTRRANLINTMRSKRMQEREPDSLRSHTHHQIKNILSQTVEVDQRLQKQTYAKNFPKVKSGTGLDVAPIRVTESALTNNDKKDQPQLDAQHVASLEDLIPRTNNPMLKRSHAIRKQTSIRQSDPFSNPDRNSLVKKFLQNSEKKREPFYGLERLSSVMTDDSDRSRKKVGTGKQSMLNVTQETPGSVMSVDPVANARYQKKTYHISVRSKISPGILQINKIKTQRDRIVKQLREECQFQTVAANQALLNAKLFKQPNEEYDKKKTNLSEMSVGFSDDSDGCDMDLEDDNNIDKAFKKLQKKKDNFQRFVAKRKIRMLEKSADNGGTNMTVTSRNMKNTGNSRPMSEIDLLI